MAAKPIVAGTDGSEESLRAVDWAAREAALRAAPRAGDPINSLRLEHIHETTDAGRGVSP